MKAPEPNQDISGEKNSWRVFVECRKDGCDGVIRAWTNAQKNRKPYFYYHCPKCDRGGPWYVFAKECKKR